VRVGDRLGRAPVVGRVSCAGGRGRVGGDVRGGAGEGDEVVSGGSRPSYVERGWYVAPTLLIGTNEMKVAREEIFGPVIVVVPFDDDDQAVAIANDSDYGLYDYVYTSDTARAFRVAKQLRCGHVGINTAQRNMEAPFGGFKMSGVGRDGGDFGPHA